MQVNLQPLDDALLESLTTVAVTQAEPDEVMPRPPGDDTAPDDTAPPWTERRRAAFTAFHRAQSLAPGAPQRTYAIVIGGGGAAGAGAGDGRAGDGGDDGTAEVAGAARLAPVPGETGTVEAGLWIARNHRNRGAGRAVIRQLLDLARESGAKWLLARTGVDNEASRRLLTEELGAYPPPPGATTVTVRASLSPVAALLARATAIGKPPPFDPTAAPPAPGALLTRWLTDALDAQVTAPHAANLATVDEHGDPDARVLLLRDVENDGAAWLFASDSDSPKGRQLAHCPAAALTLHWPEIGRQIRARGTVTASTPEEAAAEFRSRSPFARLSVHIGHQSEPLASDAAYDEAADAARQRLRAAPDDVPAGHTIYTLHAREVEFWQADPGRCHLRLRYAHDGAGEWSRTRL
ncbi:pyridoxal 5'-phosphate synthase, partial [Streptomyces sp. SM12]